jgi:hypothetical protein
LNSLIARIGASADFISAHLFQLLACDIEQAC